MIEPAIADTKPDEWDDGWGPGAVPDSPKAARGLAARLLYGQPFGFTREMVAAIRSASGYMAHYAVGSSGLRELELCEKVADRIEALLPPEQ